MVLRLRYVAGVSPAKWLRVWAERRPDLPIEAARVEEPQQLDELLTGDADVAFVRLPIEAEGLHQVPLWEELAVAVLPADHPQADAESITLADLEGEPLAPVQPESGTTVELVAAGTGHALLPQGVARLHHRRDVVAIPVTDAPGTRIALVWRVERDDDDLQEFVAVVRGRTARSSRGEAAGAEASAPPAPASTARRAQPARRDPNARRGASARRARPVRKRGRGR